MLFVFEAMLERAPGVTAACALADHSSNVGAVVKVLWFSPWQPPQMVAAMSTRGMTVGSPGLAAWFAAGPWQFSHCTFASFGVAAALTKPVGKPKPTVWHGRHEELFCPPSALNSALLNALACAVFVSYWQMLLWHSKQSW